jgi:uncharacterized protein (DUF2236 family)
VADESRILLPGPGEALADMEKLIASCVSSVSAEDPGLFGPGSVTWRILRHPAYGISAVASLLLEALHPVAMAAIDQHSDYRRDAWRRAHRTTDYVFTIAFSGADVARAAGKRVRDIHRRISGVDPVTGRSYRVDDPDLLLWIHCVNTEMALRGQEAFGGGLTVEDGDRFVREQIQAALLVGLEEAEVPASRERLRAAIAEAVDPVLSPPAAEFARLLLTARMPLAMRPFWSMHVAGAVTLLPTEARRLYDFPKWIRTGAIARASIRAMLRTMRLGYFMVPAIREADRRLDGLERAAQPGPGLSASASDAVPLPRAAGRG